MFQRILILLSPEVLEGTLSEKDDNHPVDSPKEGEVTLDIDDIVGEAAPIKKTEVKEEGKEEDGDKAKIGRDDGQKEDDDVEARSGEKEQKIDGKPIEDKKVEDKKDDKTKVEEKQKRDYTGFDPEDVKILEKQPNGVFNLLAPALKKYYSERSKAQSLTKEVETLKKEPGRIPDAWYEKEDAYLLSPEYQKVADNYGRAQLESQHWEQQLINIKGGKPWQNLTYDGKQYGVSAPQEPKDGDEFRVQRAYNDALRLQDKFQGQAEKLAETFKEGYKNLSSFYDPAIEKHFGALIPELQPKKEHEEIFLGVVHPAHKNSSLAKLSAKMFSLILNQGQMIKSYMDKGNIEVKNKADEVKAGAKSKGAIQSGKVLNNKDEIDFEELNNELKGEQ